MGSKPLDAIPFGALNVADGTHKHPVIKAWLAEHPRVHLHLTPTYSSWLNLVERFFVYVTSDLLQRGDHEVSTHSEQTSVPG